MAVYTKAIGLGILYGLTSILLIFCLLEANVLDSQGKTGSLYQSGSVLFANIIFVANLRILVMSRGLRPFLLFAVYGSIGFYWLFYYIYA